MVNDKIDEQISCEIDNVHCNIVENVKGSMPKDEILQDLADLFKVFGDSTRVKILYALFESEMCVCDIAEVLGMTQSAISHQLRVLKNARLVKNRREGKEMYYSFDDEHINDIFNSGLAHIKEEGR